MVSVQQSSKITMNTFRVKINLLLYFVVNFMIITVILVFFMVISVNRRLFRYFGSYSGISVIPVILVNRRTDQYPVSRQPFYYERFDWLKYGGKFLHEEVITMSQSDRP